MRSPADFKKEIEARLKKYLSRDSTGIRHEVLAFFVRIKSATIPELYTRLSETFAISYHSVASMVGIIASRMGILHVKRDMDGANAVYQIKEDYVCMVARLLKCG
ncbi:MAG: DUF2551 domain-containing protein [Methanofollis liminatans]|jgi:hypothetical protein|uniref:DUF2551 domain-containing protein n=1 Tax=Methanofollis liminatans DSM 4140 TaxID=28892 RepID=J0S9E4_9EURY|nr:DUF2551 domain-containing protein [Methanofollis liminatans]EJG07234.1 hypothetical protein Metli_1278 [Methanofollis liminatans DSM 4140]MDD3111709.1 DUF2551 domain-containing protein [Methanofollis liminatans]